MVAIIEAKNLTKKYGEFTAVNNISFEVEKGDVFAFLGPNGAGKTTTIKMLTTVLEPTSGTITIAQERDKNDIRKQFGIVFQDPSVDDELTAYENMEFHAVLYGVSKSVRKERIKSLLEMVDLYERKDKRLSTFSGGMKRRLEIARGLLHNPKVLFLDEPTAGLDPQTRNTMWSYLAKLNKKEGITIFFTTHYMEEAQGNAKHIAIIDRGQIIAKGTSAELKRKTKTKTLEQAFLSLTGKAIREQGAETIDAMRTHSKLWGRR